MVLRPPDAVGDMWLLVISTKFTRPLAKFWMDVPWALGGHPETGLWQECVLKANWAVRMNQRDMTARIGRMPSDYAEKASEYAVTAALEKQRLEKAKAAANQGAKKQSKKT